MCVCVCVFVCSCTCAEYFTSEVRTFLGRGGGILAGSHHLRVHTWVSGGVGVVFRFGSVVVPAMVPIKTCWSWTQLLIRAEFWGLFCSRLLQPIRPLIFIHVSSTQHLFPTPSLTVHVFDGDVLLWRSELYIQKKHLHTAVSAKTPSLISSFVKFRFCGCVCVCVFLTSVHLSNRKEVCDVRNT